MKKWTEADREKRLACVRDFAWQHAGEQMNLAELHLRKHPGENLDFDAAHAELQEFEKELVEKVEYDFADKYRSAYLSYAGTLAMETYMRGVMDGARLHYAIISRELSTDGK